MPPTRTIHITAHIAGWLIFSCLIAGFLVSLQTLRTFTGVLFSLPFIFFLGTYVFLFYLNSHVLIPGLYLKQKIWLYLLVIVALFLLFFYLQPFEQLMLQRRPSPSPSPMPPLQHGPPPPRFREGPGPSGRKNFDIVSIILFVMVWAVSTAIQIALQWRRTERRAVEAEAGRTKAELSFLQSQLNPHFLFNTLNNIYSLIITKNEAAPQAVLQLSSIMRYVTDEATQPWVPLEWELECVQHFINLQRLRVNEKTSIVTETTGDMSNRQIPPLILMTFVENAFKYGTSNHEPSEIRILTAISGEQISFRVSNPIFRKEDSDRKGGIGLQNTILRLQQLYPGSHTLNITDDGQHYSVVLTLQNAL